MPYIYQLCYLKRNILQEDGLPPLGNALVWAWSTATNKVVNTDLVDHKTIFPLEGNNARLQWKFTTGCYMDAQQKRVLKQGGTSLPGKLIYIGGNEHATGHLLYLPK
jgi:leucyl-tRNA synthetase